MQVSTYFMVIYFLLRKIKTMLTPEEIKDLKKFNEKALLEGLRQSEMRLKDELDTKDNFDKKSYTLLSIYLSFTTILISFSKIFSNQVPTSIMCAATVSALAFIVGCYYAFKSISSQNYGALGTYPDSWLQKEVIEGGNSEYLYALTHVLYGYYDRIQVSFESNNLKADYLDRSIMAGIIGPILFLIISAL